MVLAVGELGKKVVIRRLAPWLTLERMVARLVATSAPGHEPERLIAGLRLAFGPTP